MKLAGSSKARSGGPGMIFSSGGSQNAALSNDRRWTWRELGLKGKESLLDKNHDKNLTLMSMTIILAAIIHNAKKETHLATLAVSYGCATGWMEGRLTHLYERTSCKDPSMKLHLAATHIWYVPCEVPRCPIVGTDLSPKLS